MTQENERGAQKRRPREIGAETGNADGRDGAARKLLEGLDCCRLRGAHLAHGDRGNVVVFSADGSAGQAAQHGELANMREGVGDGALEEAIDGRVEFGTRREVGIEGAKRGEKPLLFGGPRKRLGVVPGGTSLHHGNRPVEEVAHMRQDLDGAAARTVEIGEALRGVFKSPRGAVSKGSDGMAEQFAFFVHAENIAQAAGRVEDFDPVLNERGRFGPGEPRI